MTRREAALWADRINGNTLCVASVVRVLPEHIDPPHDDDNGWDVLILTEEHPENFRTRGRLNRLDL